MKNKSNLREWVDSIVIAAVLAVLLRSFLFQIYKIPTTSMVPTLKPGDKIFVTKLVYGPKVFYTNWRIPGIAKPKRGEVVVFIPPHEKERFIFKRKVYIKRLIGVAGDRIKIKDGNIEINGKLAFDPRIANNYYTNQGDYAKQGMEIVVPQGKYFFLGDNSRASLDSRFWGFVDEADIIGKALFIWWPFERIGMIE